MNDTLDIESTQPRRSRGLYLKQRFQRNLCLCFLEAGRATQAKEGFRLIPAQAFHSNPLFSCHLYPVPTPTEFE